MISKFIVIISNDIPLLNVDFRKCTVGEYYDIYDKYIADVYNIIQPTRYWLCLKWSIPPQMAFLSEWKWWISGWWPGWQILSDPYMSWGCLWNPASLHDWRWLRPMGKYVMFAYGCESKRFGIEQVLVDIPFNTPFNTLLNRRVPIVQYPPFNTLVQYPCSINILLQF